MMTHSVEHCGADGFDDEVVIQTQLLQVLVEVIWIQSQRQTNKQFTFKIQRAALLYSHQPTVTKELMRTETLSFVVCNLKKEK